MAIPVWGPTGAADVSRGTQALWTVWVAALVLGHLDESPPVEDAGAAREAPRRSRKRGWSR